MSWPGARTMLWTIRLTPTFISLVNLPNRDHWVDYAKGLGILLVVIGHVSRGAFHGGVPMDADVFKLVDSVI